MALDAMEHDAYWAVLEKIQASSKGDVAGLAALLEQFGLLELGSIGAQARHRLQFLDALETLIGNPATLEKEIHQAIEKSLWVLGRQFSLLSSNKTLRRIVDQYCSGTFLGKNSDNRPDLLLSQAFGDHYVLIEFKRPAHIITRMDVAQAENYRDQLTARLSSTSRMDIVLIGKARDPVLADDNLAKGITVHSFASIISGARSELDWILSSLSAEPLSI